MTRYSLPDSRYIQEAWARGIPAEKIAATVGRSMDSVRAHANHHKVKRPAWFIEQMLRQAAEMCLDGRLNRTHRKRESLDAITHPPGHLLAESTIAEMYGPRHYEDAAVRPPNYQTLRLPTPPSMMSAASCLVQACG